MTRHREHSVYLEDILDAIGKAESFVEGMSRDDFGSDDKTVFAVIRALEIIGEAAKQVPQDMRDKAPDIPWRSMVGMRDKLIHSYSTVNLDVVWKTLREELPKLRASVEKLLSELAL